MRLKNDEYNCLVMAMIRCKAYYDGKPLTEALAGLGSPSEYKQAYDDGYLVPAYGHITPRVANWWKLTEKGAAVVGKWLEEGYGRNVKPCCELSRSQINPTLPPREVM